MKNINRFTIKEYKEYVTLVKEYSETGDAGAIFKLFGLDVSKLTVEQFNENLGLILKSEVKNIGVKPHYFIGKRRYKADLNITNIKAGQFIDLQNIIKRDKEDLASLIACFLIPQNKKFFYYTTPLYSTGYDIIGVIEELENNMTICEAKSLSDFFLFQSQRLLKVTQDYLKKKKMKERMKKIKKQTI